MVGDTGILPSLIVVHYECILHSVINCYCPGIVSIGIQVGSDCHQIVGVVFRLETRYVVCCVATSGLLL